tara:strand:+ start:2817 stop:3344 length:528 start_codon:yes stop_codon:yes gene_type:complete
MDKLGELHSGELRVANDSLVLVLELNDEDGYQWANVMYVHDQVDMATSVDLVISTDSPTVELNEALRLPNKLVIQTDLYSTCDLDHIGMLVGTLGEHEEACLNELWRSKERKPTITSDYHYTGEPFSNVSREEAEKDPRWQFKVDQGSHTRTMQSKSLSKLFEMMDNGELQNLAI